MRYILIILLLLIVKSGISQKQQRTPVADTLGKSLSRAHLVGKDFNLEKAKTDKLSYIDKDIEDDYAKVPLQFKDSTGRRRAYDRLEKKRELQYGQVLSKEQIETYKQNKARTLK